MFYVGKPPIIDEIPRSGHCVIEASAGTGKTFTIKNIFLDLLLEGYRPEDFLIVTFTRKATGELRERLKGVIEETIAKAPEKWMSDEAKVAPSDVFLEKPEESCWEIDAGALQSLNLALQNFHRAQVSTLDSLTQRILRENLDISLVQSDAKVQTTVSMDRAFEDFTRNVVPRDPWLLAMMASYDCYAYISWDDIDISDSYQRSPHNLYDDLKEYTKQSAEKAIGVKFPEGIYCAKDLFYQYIEWFETVRQALQSEDWETHWETCLKGFQEVCEKKGRAKGSLSSPLEKVLTLFKDSMRHAKPHDWLRMASFWKDDWREPLNDEMICRYQNAMHNDLLRAIFSMRIYTFSKKYFVAEYAVEKYRKCMQKFHIDQASYQFDTYAEMLCETLRMHEGEELAARLRRKWKIVIVDEFQDTNPLQWEILERCFFHHEDQTRLFLIGDPKQAIYAFRGGDIYTYKKVVQDIREMYQYESENHILALTKNYRSTPAILDAINRFYYRESDDEDDALFSSVSREDTHQYLYRNVYDHEIGAGHNDWRCLKTDGNACDAVSLIPIDDHEGIQEDWNEALADAIVEEIKYYLGPNCPLIQKGESVERLKKIYILGREHNDFIPIEKRLVLAGIPYTPSKSDDDQNHYAKDEILELTRIMMAISDPMKPGYFEAAIHTTFFGCHARETAFHASSDESLLRMHFKRWSEMSRNPEKFSKIFQELLEVTQYASRLALFSYTQTPYESVCRVIHELCARALYDGLDWNGLLDWMHQMRRGEIAADSIQTMEPKTAIQFLTIHKCKGLEADVVFLLYRRENKSTASKDDKATRYYHIFEDERWTRVLRPPKGSRETLEAAFFEASQEDERLLYVALTRAAVRLYLPRYLSVKNGNDTAEGQISATPGNKESRSKTKSANASDKPQMPDVYQRLQRVLCKLYGKDVPTNMLPLYQSGHDNGPSQDPHTLHISMHDATKQFFDVCSSPVAPKHGKQTIKYCSHKTASYSSLKHKTQQLKGSTVELVPAAWYEPIQAKPEMLWPDLPKGRNTGLFLHAIFERIPYDAVTRLRHATADTWLEDLNSPDVVHIRHVFDQCAREYQYSANALAAAQKLVFLTLTTPQPEFAPQGLCGVDGHRSEVEFLVRYDAIEHGPEAELCQFFEHVIGDAEFKVLDGDFLTGSIDCCYRIGQTWYILDWKSDCLESYTPEDLKKYVDEHYDYQVAIYRHAFKRMMATMLSENQDYQFGGMIYVFVRGISPNTPNGFVFLAESEE